MKISEAGWQALADDATHRRAKSNETPRVLTFFTADLARPRRRANRMNRRNFITVFSGAAAAWPLARAQKNFLLCPALAQDEPILGARSSGLNVNKLAHFQIWRTITLGTYSGVDGYRRALASAGIKIGNAADEILGRPAFPYGTMKTDVELVLLSAADLGVKSESSLADVYKRARQAGLELCPAEVGPQLRLDYRNQPLGEALHIAMQPVATYNGEPTILALANFAPSGLLLIGSDGRSEFMVPSTFRFVFALPTNGRLEAMRDDPPIVSFTE